MMEYSLISHKAKSKVRSASPNSKPTTPTAGQRALPSQGTLSHRPRRLHPRTPILVLLPIGQNIADPRRIRQPIDLLEILPRERERFGRDVGNVFADQLARIDSSLVDFLKQEGAERFDAGAQEGAVEGDVDALERDGGEAALQVERFGLGFGLFGAFADDFDEMGFDVFEGHGLHEVLDVDFLGFDVVSYVGEAVEGSELRDGLVYMFSWER